MNLCAGRYAFVLVALTFISTSGPRLLAAAVPPDLAGLLSPALSKANRVIRIRQSPDATSVQIASLNAKQAAALQRLKGSILGRRAVAVLVVNDVVNDSVSGGYDVDGTIVLPQRRFYNLAARRDATAARSAYSKTLGEIAKTDYNDEFTHPVRQKKKDEKSALIQLRENVSHINRLVAPPSQKIVLHTFNPKVAAWNPGQTRKVLGRIIDLRMRAETYSYPDSSDTDNGGDYVSCTVYMHWIAEIPSRSAKVAIRAVG